MSAPGVTNELDEQVSDDALFAADRRARNRRLAAFLISAVVMILVLIGILVVAHVDPLRAGQAIWKSTFGSWRSFGETLVRATPLLLIALTLIPSLRSGLYNIGAPGQMGAGALAATVVALHLSGAPQAVSIAACALAAGIAGTLVAALPGWLKARFSVNEIITTLAMNFVVVAVLGWLLNGPMKSGFGNLPQSDLIPDNAHIPILIPGTRVTYALLVALAFVPLLMLLDRSKAGYRLRIFNSNPLLSRQAGFSRSRYILGLMMLGGLGAGLAGWIQVVTVDQRLYATVAQPVGYTGLFVALLGGLSAIGSVLAAFVLGALLHGGDGLQVGANVSPEIVQVILGLILFVYAVQRGRNSTTQLHRPRRALWTRSMR